jgi:hypothetical protein
MAVNLRLNDFESWLRKPLTRGYVYHKGELARDAARDPELAALAARVREVSTGAWEITSRCGHQRGFLAGSGKVEVTTRLERGERVHIVRRLG